ncbi:hypothetical protein CsSME_00007176 [Camellia sinensis var. sinensis]
MNKLNIVENGGIKLPPGFRFQPTDEEIVFHYLTSKNLSCPLPASPVSEITVCNYDPWDLPGEAEQERYFFTKKEAKYQNGNRTNRSTSCGYWKATGSDKKITCSTRKHVMGMKKTLVFYTGKSPNGSRTDWIMHEYSLVNLGTTNCNDQQPKNSTQSTVVQRENWVLCRIFVKKRSTKGNDEIVVKAPTENRVENQEVVQPRLLHYDFMMRNLNHVAATSSSSSSSSTCDSRILTEEVTSIGFDHHQQTSNNGQWY